MRVLLIDVDSLRPDHLGCYGYGRDTSPTIDRIAADGVRFEECFVSDSPCLPSRTALATCRFGANSGVVTHFGAGQQYREPGDGHDQDPDRPLAFRHLFEAGTHTATVTSFAQRHLAHHFTAGFASHVQPSSTAGTVAVEDGADVTDAAVDWLSAHGDGEDWLLHVNYWDAHHPYLGVAEYADEVRESGPAPEWPDRSALDDQRGTTGPRTADFWPEPGNYLDPDESLAELRAEWPFPDEISDREQVDHLFTGYDAAIRKVDAEIERLLDALARTGIREETAVVVTGDHGEAFGEHGIYVEHAFPHEAVQRVPMVVSWPGVTDGAAGSAVDSLVYQFDLVPTVCELLDASVPDGWDADAFTPALRGEAFDGRGTLVCGHGIYTWGRAVYTDRWAYARLFHPGAFSHPGLYNDPALPDGGLELLHDRTADAPTAENLIGERPEVAADLRGRLDEWTADAVQAPAADLGGEDPLWGMAVTEGPFLYYDPDDLMDVYRETGRTEAQLAAVARARSFPREE